MKPVSPAGILVVRAPWIPWTPRVHLRTSNVVASGWQEGKRTNTLGGLMVDELVARLLWGCWRHLARGPLGDTAVLSRSRSLCATPSGRGKVFGAHPGSTCCRLVSGFLFSQGLSFHLVTLRSFVRPLRHRGVLLQGLTDTGKAL